MSYLPESWQDWWLNDDIQLYQFMAKDNVPFHSILLPAMILGQHKKRLDKSTSYQ